jgi:hypothetical protein
MMARSPADEQAFRTGRGNWEACTLGLERLLEAAAGWAGALNGVERGWLCWHVDPDRSLVQQRLVRHAGWTPVVGFDPRAGPPPVIAEAVPVDFNRTLRLPVLYPHFVLEFAFAFIDRLAFWHSDLLLTEADMKHFAGLFGDLQDGAMAAVPSPSGWRRWLAGPKRRYWELLGCTTHGASRRQFDQGAGWWMHFNRHPNFAGDRTARRHWEYGCGIDYWKRSLGGRVVEIDERRIAYGHFTRINQNAYVATASNNVFRDLSQDIRQNYDLGACLAELNLSHLLAEPAD